MNAISRSPIHGIKILLDLFYSKRSVKGKGMGYGTLLAVRSNDENIPDLLESLCQYNNAF
jgi:hypothetical protein